MASKFTLAKYELDLGYIVPIRLPVEFITDINPEAEGELNSETPIFWRHLSKKHGWYARGIYLSYDVFDASSGEGQKSNKQHFYPILTPLALSLPEHNPFSFRVHWNNRDWRGTTKRPEQFVGSLKSYQKILSSFRQNSNSKVLN